MQLRILISMTFTKLVLSLILSIPFIPLYLSQEFGPLTTWFQFIYMQYIYVIKRRPTTKHFPGKMI